MPAMSTLPSAARFTFLDDIDRIYDAQQRRRESVGAAGAAERIAKLRRLHGALLARRGEIHQALWDDYRKPAAEVDLSEIYPAVGEARHAMRNLREWMRPRPVATPIALLGSRSSIHYEPKGVVPSSRRGTSRSTSPSARSSPRSPPATARSSSRRR